MSGWKGLVSFWVALIGIGAFLWLWGPGMVRDDKASKTAAAAQDAMQHRVDLLEQDFGHLEQRVVSVEQVLAEMQAAQAASAARAAEAEAKAAEPKPAEAKPAEEPLPTPVSVLPPAIPPASSKHKPAARRQAPSMQRAQRPHDEKVYPWSAWENPPPEEGNGR